MQAPSPSKAFRDGSLISPEDLVTGMSLDLGSVTSNMGRFFECNILENNTILRHRNRLLLVTQQQIIVLTPNPFKKGEGSILQVYDIEDLEKLRFKRGTNGILSLSFKPSGTECKFVMTGAYDCVEYIKYQMSKRGIEGSHTTKNSGGGTQSLQSAEAFMETTKDLIAHYSVEPSVQLITEIMELMRESAEKFGANSDDRYLTVVQDIKSFLQRPDVTDLLSNPPAEPTRPFAPQPRKTPPSATASTSSTNIFGLNLTALRDSAKRATESVYAAAQTTALSAQQRLQKMQSDLPPNSPLQSIIPKAFQANKSESTAAATRVSTAAQTSVNLVPPVPSPDEKLNSGDELALQLTKDLDTINSDFANLLESFETGDEDNDDGDTNEFSMAELDELMNVHGVARHDFKADTDE